MKLRHARFLFTELQRPIGFNAEEDDELKDFDNRFRIILRKHLTVLAWWSIFNTIGGLFALVVLRDVSHKVSYNFWMMSCIWGIVNFAVTVALFNHTFYRKFRKGSSNRRFMIQNHVERIILLNIGIDVAYIFLGFWLREHSVNYLKSRPELWLGFGWSIVIQGHFLLILDITFYRLHRLNFRKAQDFLVQFLKSN